MHHSCTFFFGYRIDTVGDTVVFVMDTQWNLCLQNNVLLDSCENNLLALEENHAALAKSKDCSSIQQAHTSCQTDLGECSNELVIQEGERRGVECLDKVESSSISKEE